MFWLSFLSWIEQVGSWLLVIVCFSALVGIVILVAWKIHHRIAAIFLTAVGVLLCTVPLVSTVNILVDSKSKNLVISQKKEELKLLSLQVENESIKKEKLELENRNLNLSLTVGNLSNEIDLLKSAQISMNSLSKICELALIETQLKQTDVHKETINSREGMGVFADRIDNEVLVITTHDINAKYGVDLREVLIKEDSDGILRISGIKSRYIGSNRYVSDTKLSEIREIEYKKSKDEQEILPSKTTVLSDNQSLQRAAGYASKFEIEFQKRLAKGQESDFLDDAVVKLAQNFITVTLAPLKQEIVFDDTESSSVPILNYLNDKIKIKQAELENLPPSIHP